MKLSKILHRMALSIPEEIILFLARHRTNMGPFYGRMAEGIAIPNDFTITTELEEFIASNQDVKRYAVCNRSAMMLFDVRLKTKTVTKCLYVYLESTFSDNANQVTFMWMNVKKEAALYLLSSTRWSRRTMTSNDLQCLQRKYVDDNVVFKGRIIIRGAIVQRSGRIRSSTMAETMIDSSATDVVTELCFYVRKVNSSYSVGAPGLSIHTIDVVEIQRQLREPIADYHKMKICTRYSSIFQIMHGSKYMVECSRANIMVLYMDKIPDKIFDTIVASLTKQLLKGDRNAASNSQENTLFFYST